jgi:Flp pilus assembly protein TadG
MLLQTPAVRRRGAVAPLAAFLLAFILIALVAFSVDTGWIVSSRTELQSAADAAALAGADALMDGYVQYQLAGSNSQSSNNQATILANSMASARQKAEAWAAKNSAGGVSSLTLNDSDVEFGYTDSNGNYTPYSSGQPFPNTIKVTMRRDSSANGSLGLFFGPVIHTSSVDLKATAAAVLMGGTIDNFNANTGLNVGMLPMTFDVNAWKNYLATGQWPDGTVSLDANGNPQLQVYPSVKDSGNFGQLSLDDSHVGASTERGWIDNGMAPSDIQALQSANLIPLSNHPANTWDWIGDTGFKASLVMDINSYPGKSFLLPLFTPYSPEPNYSAGTGNGSHYYYDIVQFVGVKIMPGGGNRQVLIEPAAVVDPSAVFAGGGPTIVDTSKSGSSMVTTFSYPRLSQ